MTPELAETLANTGKQRVDDSTEDSPHHGVEQTQKDEKNLPNRLKEPVDEEDDEAEHQAPEEAKEQTRDHHKDVVSGRLEGEIQMPTYAMDGLW